MTDTTVLPDPTGTPEPADLAPTWFLDYEHPEVVAFVDEVVRRGDSPLERARRLFVAVRDRIRYNPYSLTPDPAAFRASAVLRRGEAFCVPKAILLTAALRGAGIPARLGFADVRNHLASAKLLERMGTDLFAFHGYTALYLDGRWFKVTPAFNKELCERFGVPPLEFDGTGDAVFHAYDDSGRRFMSYIRDRGLWQDFPFAEMLAAYREVYPHWFEASGVPAPEADFYAEVESERGSVPGGS